MSDKAFVDTNILLYAHDSTKGVKHSIALQLLERLWELDAGVLSTQVLQEFCFSLRRKVDPQLGVEETGRMVRNYLGWEVVVNDGASILGALKLEERYKISFWDALIVQAAQTAGADVLYSEDFNDQQMYGSVRAVNPFRR
jgi:predicted nucleic acid-binding protein